MNRPFSKKRPAVSYVFPAWKPMLLAVLFMLSASRAAGQTQTKWNTLNYSIYFCSQEIEDLLVPDDKRRETLEYFAPVRPQKFYLECSSRTDIDLPQTRKLVEALRAEGIASSGALIPAGPNGPLCYNNPNDMALLEERVRKLAEVFDEFIVDDWLFTTCTCPVCVEGKGRRSWPEYRQKLVAEKSKRHILEAARRINPRIRMIVKYPNWAEGYAWNGYDIALQTRQFDAICTGIETRVRAEHDQHIPIYSGFVFEKWISAIDPRKWIGSWFDNYGMQGQADDFIAQMWQAVLAQAPEVILWSGGHLFKTGPFSDVYPYFRERLPEFDKFAGLLRGKSKGVPIYMPPGSTAGEYNVFGHMGMAGIPLAPVVRFPTDVPIALFTTHALHDPNLPAKLMERLKNGKDVFLTWKAYCGLRGTEIGSSLQLMDEDGTVESDRFRTWVPGKGLEIIRSDRPFVFPKIATTTWPYVRDVALVREDYDFAVFIRARVLGGTLYVLNMPDNAYDIQRLPSEVLNAVRRVFTESVGSSLEGTGGVGFYPFESKQIALFNMTDATVPVRVRISGDKPDSGWVELMHGKMLMATKEEFRVRRETVKQVIVETTLRPFEIDLIQEQ